MNSSRRNTDMPLVNEGRSGLSGIASVDKKYYRITDKNDTVLSLNIDECFQQLYPQANRWDYLIQNNTKRRILFSEVHEATNHGVDLIKKKFDWLYDMIHHEDSGFFFEPKHHNLMEFYWIRTGKYMLNKNTTAFKRLTSKKYCCIVIVKSLDV